MKAERAQTSSSVAVDARVKGKDTLLPEVKRTPMLLTVTSVMRHWQNGQTEELQSTWPLTNFGAVVWDIIPRAGTARSTAPNWAIVPCHVVRSQMPIRYLPAPQGPHAAARSALTISRTRASSSSHLPRAASFECDRGKLGVGAWAAPSRAAEVGRYCFEFSSERQ